MIRRWTPILAISMVVLAACADDPSDAMPPSTTAPSTTAAPTTTAAVTTTTAPPVVEQSVALIVGDAEVDVERIEGQDAFLSIPVYLASLGAALQFEVTRADYDQPVTVDARLVSPSASRSLPTPKGAEFDWTGFQGFVEVTIRDADGKVAANEALTFCPNGPVQRINATGPDLNPYPYDWSGQVLSLGSVWGIAQGWAVPVSGYGGITLPGDVPAGDYSMQVEVAEPYSTWLGGLEPVTVDLKVTDADAGAPENSGDDDGDGIPNAQDDTFNFDQDNDGIDDSIDPLIDIDGDGLSDFEDSEVDVNGDGFHDIFGIPNGILPTDAYTEDVVDEPEQAHDHSGRPDGSDARPDRATVPDLRALPAFQISTSNAGELDLLNFGAVTWNAGPAPMVIDGFRSPTDPELMDGYQTFYADGKAIGSAPIGTLEYHRGGGHDHWHFQDFSRYELVSEQGKSQLSGKQSWCLANNYPVDLTLPGVVWTLQQESLATSCGSEDALWVRQVLAVGWGDLYMQSVSGQSFDITDLPNGVYTIRITANPEGNLYEASTRNNASERIVRLGGVPGARTVSVPPYRGIDTEALMEMPPGFPSPYPGPMGELLPGA
jgi:hypothetical protein